MTLQEKYGLLVDRDEVINKSLPEEQLDRISTKLSLDMYAIHYQVDSRRKRIDVLVQYFTNRPGMIDEKCPTPVEQAFKMMLYGDFAEITHNIVKISGCKVDDVLIKAEFEDDGIAITTGTHKELDEELEPVVKKMMKYMIPPVIQNVISERNDYINGDIEAEIDEETEKALKKMDWDRTVKGEA
jgi:hypothetical protein